MQKWEYQTLVRLERNREWNWADPNEKRGVNEVLNALGQQGWELVSVMSVLAALDQPSAVYRASSNYDGAATSVVQHIFKRPV